MVRKIFQQLNEHDSSLLRLEAIIPRHEVEKLLNIDKQIELLLITAKQNVAQAESDARKILCDAKDKSSAIVTQAQNQTLCQIRLEELSLENEQRKYWQETLQQLANDIEETVFLIVLGIIRNFDDATLVENIIQTALNNWQAKQSMVIRVPKAVMVEMSSRFPYLNIVEGNSVTSHVEIEINNGYDDDINDYY